MNKKRATSVKIISTNVALFYSLHIGTTNSTCTYDVILTATSAINRRPYSTLQDVDTESLQLPPFYLEF